MDSHQDDVQVGLIPQTQPNALPVTPQPTHASIPQGTTDAVARDQAHRVENATGSMTPPPSAQVPSDGRAKSISTPSYSHISTPPPTVDTLSQESTTRSLGGFARTMTTDQIANATADELRTKVAELQAAYQEAKMSAAHHKLQYQMLAQESAAAIERMAVEARMVQCENEVIHVAEQAKATPARPSPQQEGTIPVQKELYQRMCRDIQQLSDTNNFLEAEHRQQEKLIFRQDNEIASLSDKVAMMRDRIRERRDHQNRARSASTGVHLQSTPRSVYSTPRRPQAANQESGGPLPFAALLQASAMASQEAGAAKRQKGHHTRNIHSLSSLPVTPSRKRKNMNPHAPLFQTPQGGGYGHAQQVVPSTAPAPRISNLRTPDVHAHQTLPVKHTPGPLSDGTVSASDRDDDDDHDSEAETEILEPDEIDESRASFAAAQMLRAQPQPEPLGRVEERAAKRGGGGGLRQGRLFGSVRKAGVGRALAGGEESPRKRTRMLEGVGLGIEGVGR